MLAISVWAKVPAGTYAISELDKAKAEAHKRGKAVAFLVSDPDSKYRNTREAASLAIKELRGYAVVVFLKSKEDEETVMPPPVVTGLRGATMGTFDPRVVVLSADLTQTFATVGSEKIVGNPARDTYRNLRKSMRKKLDGWKPSGKPPAGELIWVRANGRHYRGRFVEVREGRLHVESEKFGKGSVALKELSSASLAFAQQLLASAKSEPEPAGRKLESWTSSDGKSVKARFVNLNDGRLTVETEEGKSYTFPLGRLDPKSQARARELAGERG